MTVVVVMIKGNGNCLLDWLFSIMKFDSLNLALIISGAGNL
jgi:hypothetical protein